VRTGDLARNLAGVRARLDAAARASGRDPATVGLVAVSKTWPAADVLALRSLGVTDFGESYDAEARAKAAALDAAGAAIRWHFVGRVQRNKCRSIAGYASVVHSVDRPEVAVALGSAAHRVGREIDALVQVSFDGDPGRGGTTDPDRLADQVRRTEGLRFAGVMGVPPPGAPPRPAYARLREIAERLGARHISAGMTGDLEDAVAEGSTMVRVGTALFGVRPVAIR
jgi:pyridoxal phosphate enzyme (YggS family)